MFVFFSLIISTFVIIYLLVENYKSRIVQLGNLIPGPQRIPFFGTYGIPLNGKEMLEFQEKMIKKYGNLYKTWIGNKIVITTSDPVDAEAVLNSQFTLDKGATYKLLEKWLGTGLLTSSGQKWHKRRKALTPTFHFKILEQFIDIFNKKGMKFLEVMKQRAGGNVFNIQMDVANLTLDIICETAMGLQLNVLENPEYKYIVTVKGITDYISRIRHMHWVVNILKGQRKLDEMIEILHSFTNNVIHAKKLERQKIESTDVSNGLDEIKESKKKTAFLELLLNMSEEKNSSVVTHEDIREEVDTFMFEGHDTTASVISSTLYLLGKHQHIQEKLYKEVVNFIPYNDYQLTHNDLKEMKYLEMVIKESMRLYPAVPNFTRLVSKELKLPSGYILPEGSYVTVSAYQIHRNPKYFSNPEEFNPDNFLQENTSKRHPYAFIPFSAGPRNCIGQKFAMLEMKASISKFLYQYRVEYGGSDIQPSTNVILNSLNGYPVRIVERQHNL